MSYGSKLILLLQNPELNLRRATLLIRVETYAQSIAKIAIASIASGNSGTHVTTGYHVPIDKKPRLNETKIRGDRGNPRTSHTLHQVLVKRMVYRKRLLHNVAYQDHIQNTNSNPKKSSYQSIKNLTSEWHTLNIY